MSAEYPSTQPQNSRETPEPQRVGHVKNIVNTLATYAELTAAFGAVALFSAQVKRGKRGREERKLKQDKPTTAASTPTSSGADNQELLRKARASQVERGKNRGKNKSKVSNPHGVGHRDRSFGRGGRQKN